MERVATLEDQCESHHVQREPAVVETTRSAQVQEPEDLRRHEFERLARRARTSVYSLAHHLLSNAAEAEDVAQDALLRAWLHFDRYDRDRPFEAWVLRIVRNLALDTYRRRKRKPTLSLDTALWGGEGDCSLQPLLPYDTHDPQKTVIGQEMADFVVSALAQISPSQREALSLHSLEHLSYEAVAVRMNCPVGTIRSRVHRGRVAIRECLTRAGYLE